MFVFVSHLGRAAIHQCADAAKPVADATKELEKSLLHLDRAIMDAHKMLVLRLRHPDTRRYFRKHMPPDMWRTIVMARCLEHDRLTHDHKEFTARIRQYSKLFPVADRILADLDGRLARIQTH